MFVVLQIISECPDHDGLEKTVDQFQQVFELNTMVFDLYFLVLGGGNDFEVSRNCRDEFHDECEIIMKSIAEVHW